MAINERVFMQSIYPTLSSTLKENGNGEALIGLMRGVLGEPRITNVMSEPHFGSQVFFGSKKGEKDYELIFRETGVEEDSVRQAIKNCKTINSAWVVANKPQLWMCTLLCKWYLENYKNPEGYKIPLMYLAIAIYSTVQFKYFRRMIQPSILAAAVNSMSDKFTLKQEGSAFKTIFSITMNYHENYKKFLADGKDHSFFNYFINLWSRINGVVNSFKNHYEITKKSGAFLNEARDTHEDGEHVERSSSSGHIDAYTQKFSNEFIQGDIPPVIIDLSAKLSETPRSNLLYAINEIKHNNYKDINDIFNIILELYINETKQDIQTVKSTYFLNYSLKLYSRSNTTDPRVIQLKNTLDELLMRNSPQYKKSNRQATLANFRKGIFLIFVLFMQRSV